jgi:hypothetical protein
MESDVLRELAASFMPRIEARRAGNCWKARVAGSGGCVFARSRGEAVERATIDIGHRAHGVKRRIVQVKAAERRIRQPIAPERAA